MLFGIDGLTWLLIGAAVLIFIVLMVYMNMSRAKKRVYQNALDALELQKIDVSNKPVEFEIAKLRSVQKSDRIMKLVTEWEGRWQEVGEQLATVQDNISYAEETISSRDYERTDEVIEIIENDLGKLAELADKILAEIENLKSSETRNRDGIGKLRERAENLREKYLHNITTFSDAGSVIEAAFTEIDDLFMKFDEQMEEYRYDLADDIIEQVHQKLEMVEQAFEKIPLYRESIEVDIKPMLDAILESHTAMMNDGLYLSHLRVEATVIKLRKELGSITELMKSFNYPAIEKLLVELPNEAKKLRDAMKNEIDIKETFEQDVAQLKKDAAFVVKENVSLNARYDAIKESCLLKTDDETNFRALGHEISILDAGVKKLVAEIQTGDKAISDSHTAVLSYLTQLGEVTEQLRIFSVEIATLYSDSQDVKEQAIQLLHDINDMKAEFEKTPVEKNVLTYKGLLDKADDRINALLEEVAKVPIDVAAVKNGLTAATEAYTAAQQEVSLKVEQLKLAERLLVYGNRYIEREGMYLMDLTIAEDQFHQGNYETVIDKMYKILVDVEGNAFFKVFEEIKRELNCQVI